MQKFHENFEKDQDRFSIKQSILQIITQKFLNKKITVRHFLIIYENFWSVYVAEVTRNMSTHTELIAL